MNPLEIASNLFNTISILLAGRNNVHTWWTGIVGSMLFCVLFMQTKLYADAMLQVFFIGSSTCGWVNWSKRAQSTARPIRRTRLLSLGLMFASAVIVTSGYAFVLHHFTDAFAPAPDAMVLVFSVLGQLLLVGRRIETWWCWLAVNTVAVPLYFARGLHLTALLYVGFWINAIVALIRWRRVLRCDPRCETTTSTTPAGRRRR